MNDETKPPEGASDPLEMQIAEMLRLRKELDSEAPDMIVLPSLLASEHGEPWASIAKSIAEEIRPFITDEPHKRDYALERLAGRIEAELNLAVRVPAAQPTGPYFTPRNVVLLLYKIADRAWHHVDSLHGVKLADELHNLITAFAKEIEKQANLPAAQGDVDRETAFCEHGYPLEGPPWPPCGCRPAVCAVCRRQMFYDEDPRHEPELVLRKSNELTEQFAHDACVLRSFAAQVVDRATAPAFDHKTLAAKLEAIGFNEQEVRAVNIVVSELLAPAAKENEGCQNR